ESREAFNSIANHVADYYLGAPPTDWVSAYLRVRDRQQRDNTEAEEHAVSNRSISTFPALPLAKYAGTYTDSWYGDVIIEMTNGRLVMTFTHTPSLVGELEHFQFDTFI